MQHTQAPAVKPEHAPVLAVLSWAIGVLMVLAVLIGALSGKLGGWKGQIGVLIVAAIPVCALGTGLAVASLIWRKEDKRVVQGALWLNGMVTFFAFPAMVYWLLAMW